MFSTDDMERLHLGHIYKTTVWDITSSAFAWKNFLEYASRFYQYSFENIVFMYAQNRAATKMATLQEWYKNGRYVNPYQKGTVVFDYSNGQINNNYIFDIGQTHGASVTEPWKITDSVSDPLLKRLNSQYEQNCDTIPRCIKKITRSNANEVCATAVDKFAFILEDRGFPTDIIQNLKHEYLPLAKASCLFITGQRCGYGKTTDYFRAFNFLRNYRKPIFVSRLGGAISEVSSKILLNVENNIKEIEKERNYQYEYGHGTRNAGESTGRNISESAIFQQPSGRPGTYEIWDDSIQLSEGSSLSKIYRLLDRRNFNVEDTQSGKRSIPAPKSSHSRDDREIFIADRSEREKTATENNPEAGRQNSDNKIHLQDEVMAEKSHVSNYNMFEKAGTVRTSLSTSEMGAILNALDHTQRGDHLNETDDIKALKVKLKSKVQTCQASNKEISPISFSGSEALTIVNSLKEQKGDIQLLERIKQIIPKDLIQQYQTSLATLVSKDISHGLISP